MPVLYQTRYSKTFEPPKLGLKRRWLWVKPGHAVRVLNPEHDAVRLQAEWKYLLTQEYDVIDHGIPGKSSVVLAESQEFPTGDQAEHNGGCRDVRFVLVPHR